MKYRVAARFAGIAVLALSVSAWAYASSHHTDHAAAEQAAGENSVTVFKDPNCGCCKEWVEHLKKHSFKVSARDTSDMASVKATAGIPRQLHSCHTAFVNGYVVEGHVPAADIQRMLKDKPKIAGIAVAGMPAGSPGMEMGGRVDRYDVTAFTRDGNTSIFARH